MVYIRSPKIQMICRGSPVGRGMGEKGSLLSSSAKLTRRSVVKCWNLGSREEVWKTTAAENIVKSMAFTKDQKLLTASSDSTIKLFDPYNTPSQAPPIHSWLGSHPYMSLSVHRDGRSFAAATDVSHYARHRVTNSTDLNQCISIHSLDQYTAAPEVIRWPTSGNTSE